MKILIIKLGALGDIVMATPLIEAIQNAHTGGEIYLLTTPPFAPIFTAWEGLRVHAFKRRGWRAMYDIIKFTRSNHFDRIYDLQGNDRTSLVCALSGAKVRVGNHTRYPYTHHPRDRWKGNIHIFERMTRVVESAGVTVVSNSPLLPSTSQNRQRVDSWLDKNNLAGKSLVGIHGCASPNRPEKRWPYFASLADRLIEYGFVPIWLGAAADKNQNEAYIQASGGVDTSGAFTIAELACLGEYFKFAVTNDSGPMHILAASGIPVYGLFGPSDWRRNHALGQSRYVITSPDENGPLAAISAEFVWQRLISDDQI
ncbi:MAG: glycosyltransferase family 9 protein [Gammaproteobacteria bacterium]